MSTPTDGTMTKKRFVKRALRTEYKNQIKAGEIKEKQKQAAQGLRKINGRVYRLEATHRSRGQAEAEAGTRAGFTSIQRRHDGWGVFVLTDEKPSMLAALREKFARKDTDEPADPAAD